MLASEWGTDTQLNCMREAIRKAHCDIEQFFLQYKIVKRKELPMLLACQCSTIWLIPPILLHTNNSFIPKSHLFFPSLYL